MVSRQIYSIMNAAGLSDSARLIKDNWTTIQTAAKNTRGNITTLASKMKDLPEKAEVERPLISKANGISQRYQLPAVLNQVFRGRDNLMERLLRHLEGEHNRGKFTTIALHGYPGAGKTQLALQLADLIAREERFQAALWLCAADADNLDSDIYRIASKLGLLQENIAPSKKKDIAKDGVMEWIKAFGELHMDLR